MSRLQRKPAWQALSLVATVVLPLAGAAIAGRSLADTFRFPPPLRIPGDYLRFSWLAASAVVATLAALAWAWVSGARKTLARPVLADAAPCRRRHRRFPTWGWFALAWTAGWWAIAWTRSPLFRYVQCFTFFPLWCGFILTVNAVNDWRSGTCLLRRSPRGVLMLFGVSAAFWWLFEWLNRFVQNWHYLGVEGFGPVAYAVHASLCFSTVLPAVASVAEAFALNRRWRSITSRGPSWTWLQNRGTAVTLIVGGSLGLILTGAFPGMFYPALWVAPLSLLLGQDILRKERTTACSVASGNWTTMLSWMTAALVCGFFWEMWNWHSLAKWTYTVPGVDRWHVFEMPLLGYSGYLPFGVECLLVVERVGRSYPLLVRERPLLHSQAHD